MLNKTSKTLILLALSAVALAATQDAVTLKRTFTEGSTDAYTIVTNNKMVASTPQGDMEGTFMIPAKSTIKVVKVDANGIASVETTTETGESTGEGVAYDMMKENLKPRTIKEKGTLDSRKGFSVEKSGEKMEADMSLLFTGGFQASTYSIYLPFPEKALKIGDTWDVVVPKSIFMNKEDQKLVAKLVGEKEVGGVKYWVVSSEAKLKVVPDMAEIAKVMPDLGMGGMTANDIKISGTMDVKGETLFNKETGKAESALFTIKGKSAMELTQMNMSIDSGSDTSVKITRQK